MDDFFSKIESLYDWVVLVTSFFGGIILLFVDMYLRKKKVKDPTLMWIYIGLFSWVVRSFLAIGQSSDEREQLTYYLSPISNFVWAYAAFQFSRVKEKNKFQKHRELAFGIIFILGLATLLTMKFKLNIPNTELSIGGLIDVIASLIALIFLAIALCDSFKTYNFKTLFYMALLVFIGVALFQIFYYFISFPSINKLKNPILFGKLLFNLGMISLFVALPSVWGLSAYATQNIVGAPIRVPIIAILFDLRGSTTWVRELEGDGFYLRDFLRAFKEFLEKKIPENEEPSTVKFLGDGFLYVWEFESTPEPEKIEEFSAFAIKCSKEYSTWISGNSKLNWQGNPRALGVGLVEGTAWRLTMENGLRDYVGDIMNLVAKLQDKAQPNGGVIANCKILEGLRKKLKDKEFFPVRKRIKIFNEETTEVGATEGVEMEGGENTDGYCKDFKSNLKDKKKKDINIKRKIFWIFRKIFKRRD